MSRRKVLFSIWKRIADSMALAILIRHCEKDIWRPEIAGRCGGLTALLR
jgi:hypothetical protein